MPPPFIAADHFLDFRKGDEVSLPDNAMKVWTERGCVVEQKSVGKPPNDKSVKKTRVRRKATV